MVGKNLILDLDKDKIYVDKIKKFLENNHYENLIISGKGIIHLNGEFKETSSKNILFDVNFDGDIYIFNLSNNYNKNNISVQIYGKSNYIDIDNCYIKNLSISSKNLNYINIQGGQIDYYSICHSDIKNVKINYCNTKELFLQKNEFNNFIISGILNYIKIIDSNTKNINIRHAIIDEFGLYGTYNSSEYYFILDNIEINYLSIFNSNLGKSIISNTKINYLKLKNPVLNETIFNNVQFPKSDINSSLPENEKNNSEIKEYYIQLKNVMDNSGNHIQADKFFAKEMEYYGKSLEWNKKDFWNKLVYYIQKGISDFGNDWRLPILWIINLGNIYLIFTYSFNSYELLSQFTIKNYLLNLLIYFNNFATAINPFNKDLSGNITFGLLLYKILLAILIYHLVISLKRLTKR